MSQGTQKFEIHLAKEGSGLAFFSTEPGHIFGSDVGNEFGVILTAVEPHKPDFAYDIARKQTLMVYTDLTEYIIVGDTKTPLLRFFRFVWKLKAGDILTTGQYRNYQTFS